MFACLYSLSVPPPALMAIAEAFTPRFEVMGSLVVLDVTGLSRLFGSPQEIGEHLRRASSGPVRIALAPSQTAAALLVLGRAGLTVVVPEEIREALAPLPVTSLGDLDRLRLAVPIDRGEKPDESGVFIPRHEVPLPQRASVPDGSRMSRPDAVHTVSGGEGTPPVVHGASCGGGWRHPRESHVALPTRRRQLTPGAAASRHVRGTGGVRSGLATRHVPSPRGSLRTHHAALAAVQTLLDTLRRWGITTLGAFAGLPPGEVYERLGARGVLWQRLSRGEDLSPLVPWAPEDPFEAAIDLEWPIEGLEPLSFVLGRLLEPLSERLAREERGVAILHTHVHLVTKAVHARTLQLPAPMRDPKTLRTLVLLDLESHLPSAAIDRVRVLVEPTPARVTAWRLFERAQPSPERVSTLLARLTALMGDTHVGSPRLVDTWKPGVFAMEPFQAERVPAHGAPGRACPALATPHAALRRFRLPVPARVQVQEGRPVRVMTDRRGVAGGLVVQAAGPWRTSGEWWNDAAPPSALRPTHLSPPVCSSAAPHPVHLSPPTHQTSWDRDEWDIQLADGTIYRLHVERAVGQWFIEGVVD
ncbi:MAG: hypothetical protein ACT4QD_12445 [Acidobacteriota bacterium]